MVYYMNPHALLYESPCLETTRIPSVVGEQRRWRKSLASKS